MSVSIQAPAIQTVFDQVLPARTKAILVRGHPVEIVTPFPSPEDWRDVWIYFLLIDRFNNSTAPPHHLPFDSIADDFQGGSFNGVRAQLDYLKELGVGAIWLSPVLKNCAFSNTYHGYGIQDFLEIEPRLASTPGTADEELRALVDEAHARGIYIICDIVLHHTGDVFAYDLSPNDDACAAQANLRLSEPYPIHWRDAQGHCLIGNDPPQNPPADVGVRPLELLGNRFFGRRGDGSSNPNVAGGDFSSLKGLLSDFQESWDSTHFPVRDTLIRAFQYMIAKFDIDGFRIDTLKYISSEFARVFANAIREYALSIGKRNFFIFGEVYDDDETIARFIGRNATLVNDPIGVDAALDFPLFFKLPGVAKGFTAPGVIAGMYELRKQIEGPILSTHGDATKFFVTFLDNHDQKERFLFVDPADPNRLDDQLTLALGCLFALQGIPCVYYGTEQGLHGRGNVDKAVREALWGKPDAFDVQSPFYRGLQQIAALRGSQPALRYGRQYFRPISGDRTHFGISGTAPGVIAFSRILNDRELLVVANTSSSPQPTLEVILDRDLNPAGAAVTVLYSNKAGPVAPGQVIDKAAGAVEIHEVDGRVTSGPARATSVTLQPMEIQALTTA